MKIYLKQGVVALNGETVTRPEIKIDEHKDEVTFRGVPCRYRKYVYYMLNKPRGVVSATQDNVSKTVTELLEAAGHKDLFPVGRLDKDTEGLLIMTNDGELAHNLLSPKKHVKKVYYVDLEKPFTKQAAHRLAEGVDIGEDKPALPAEIEIITERSIFLTITEGKFHQVKRMMQAVDNEVIFLKRIAMGSLQLDESLREGDYRELTEEEIEGLRGHIF